jgi:hypothetical protein
MLGLGSFAAPIDPHPKYCTIGLLSRLAWRSRPDVGYCAQLSVSIVLSGIQCGVVRSLVTVPRAAAAPERPRGRPCPWPMHDLARGLSCRLAIGRVGSHDSQSDNPRPVPVSTCQCLFLGATNMGLV